MKIYYQMSTRNTSFLKMHQYLKAIGIKNNKFMLALLDPDLAGIDPHDPNLSTYYKSKVLAECMVNFWYFAREVVRVPDQGGSGKGIPLELHRGNMALFFCSIYNMNIFLELPVSMVRHYQLTLDIYTYLTLVHLTLLLHLCIKP